MKLRFVQVQTQTRKSKRRKMPKLRHKNCRKCGSINLLNAGPDQFCCDCDWHTCHEYVEKGYMNNLFCAFTENFPKQKIKETIESVPNLPKGNAPIEPDTKPTNTDSEEMKTA